MDTWCLGVIAGPPCPGGDKYGGLDLQVGGRVTEQQHVTIKKLTVMKPKLYGEGLHWTVAPSEEENEKKRRRRRITGGGGRVNFDHCMLIAFSSETFLHYIRCLFLYTLSNSFMLVHNHCYITVLYNMN